MYLNIDKSAIFIADSHYNSNRTELLNVLQSIQSEKIKTNQIFLMGDNFDFLCDGITYFIEQNKEVIDFINDLSVTKEIIYLEGNHDFNLSTLFPNVLVISRDFQPLICEYENKKIALSHGDIFMNKSYEIFTSIVRSRATAFFFNLFDINQILSKKLNAWLLQKHLYSYHKDFDQTMTKRSKSYEKYNVDFIIEGHFHQDRSQGKYINLPSLACQNKYVVMEDLI
jgi:UDP-2,3-diacylglucosamine hydrolase